ncbi:hypothetical protein J7L05_08190 [bacterium]|nr:hypothetical protein [bacterium]
MEMTWWVIGIVIVIAFIWISIAKSISAHKEKVVGGVEALVGKTGTAKTDIDPTGKFYVYGEYWDSEALGEHLKEGDKGRVVEIRSSDEQYLIVEKIK